MEKIFFENIIRKKKRWNRSSSFAATIIKLSSHSICRRWALEKLLQKKRLLYERRAKRDDMIVAERSPLYTRVLLCDCYEFPINNK